MHRYKRFFADIEVEGEIITAHCPNPGRLLGVNVPGTPALITPAKPGAKLKYRLEALKQGDVWVGVNTQWPNRLIPLLIDGGHLPELSGYSLRKPEVKYGVNSRIDWWLGGHETQPDAWVEVKNVHYSRTPGLAEFPDCVTERGAKHMLELAHMVKTGQRAVVIFCVQRDDVERFTTATDLDPAFTTAFEQARAGGVEVIALSFGVSKGGLRFARRLTILS